MRDRLTRRVVPRLVVTLSQVTAPARAAAALRRMLGRRGRVDVYIAFDDPCSAIAVLDLADRMAGRRADLALLPVVVRGIPGDPAVAAKRRHAIADARRLAARAGRVLVRDEPLEPSETEALAARAAALPAGPAREAFCVQALTSLWFGGEAPCDLPVLDSGLRALRHNERRMTRSGPYDTPAAVVGGRWFFAHDRAPQIADWLDELGWTVRA